MVLCEKSLFLGCVSSGSSRSCSIWCSSSRRAVSHGSCGVAALVVVCSCAAVLMLPVLGVVEFWATVPGSVSALLVVCCGVVAPLQLLPNAVWLTKSSYGVVQLFSLKLYAHNFVFLHSCHGFYSEDLRFCFRQIYGNLLFLMTRGSDHGLSNYVI